MLALKYRENLKSVFLMLALVLMLFAEPVLAKKTRSKSSKSSGNRSKSQQVQKSSAAPRARQSANVSRSSTRALARSRSTKVRPALSPSRQSARSNLRKTVKRTAPQARKVTTRRQPSRVRTSPVRNTVAPKITSKARQPARKSPLTNKPSPSVFGAGKSRGLGAGLAKAPIVKSSKGISWSKTSLIGKSISQKKPSVSTSGKPALSARPKISISSGRTSRIAKSISGKKPSGVTTPRVTGTGGPKINARKTIDQGGSKALRKSGTIFKRPGNAKAQALELLKEYQLVQGQKKLLRRAG